MTCQNGNLNNKVIMKTLFLLIMFCRFIPSETTVENTDITSSDDGEYYTFIWQEPMITGGCWKIDKKKRIEKDIHMSREVCKSMENKWVKFYDPIIPKKPTLISKVGL